MFLEEALVERKEAAAKAAAAKSAAHAAEDGKGSRKRPLELTLPAAGSGSSKPAPKSPRLDAGFFSGTGAATDDQLAMMWSDATNGSGGEANGSAKRDAAAAGGDTPGGSE